MTALEMWLSIAGGTGLLIIILSIIKIKPLEINFWSWILRRMGKSFHGEMLDEIGKLNNKVDNIDNKVDVLDNKMNEHEEQDKRDKILAKRKDILEFADEIYNQKFHSKEHFEEILSLIDDYEDYCNEHDNFENNKAVIAIQRVKEVYKDCLENHKFV